MPYLSAKISFGTFSQTRTLIPLRYRHAFRLYFRSKKLRNQGGGGNCRDVIFRGRWKNAMVKTYRRSFNRLLLRNLIFWFVRALYLRRQVVFRGAVSAENERHDRVCKQYQDDLHRYWRRWHTIQYQFTGSRISINHKLTLPIPFIFYSVSDW